MVSKFKMLSTKASSSRTLDELDGDSDVGSRQTRSRRSARLCVTRLQLAGAGGLETKRSALGARLSVDYSSSSSSSQSVSVLGSDTSLCQNTKYQDRLTRVHSASLFAATPEAVSLGLDVQRTWRVCSRHQTTTTVGLGVCSNPCTHNKFVFFAWQDCFE